ncbi:MAG: hypothetical protein ACLUE7_04460 [Lachnospirales bacterium]
MIVLGDKNSSNTRKLYEISKKICENVYFCETISDLRLKNLKNDVTNRCNCRCVYTTGNNKGGCKCYE